MVNRKQLHMNATDNSVISNLIKHWHFYFISPVLCFWEHLCLGEALSNDKPAGVSRLETLKSEINHHFIIVQTRCHAIARGTGRCRCKFQCVSNFTTAQHAFLVGLCL